mgnify:CR=1 FL=1
MLYTSKDDFDITNIPSYDIDIDTDIKGYIISWGSIAPDIIHTKPTFIDRSYSIYITLYNKYEIPPVFGAVFMPYITSTNTDGTSTDYKPNNFNIGDTLSAEEGLQYGPIDGSMSMLLSIRTGEYKYID